MDLADGCTAAERRCGLLRRWRGDGEEMERAVVLLFPSKARVVADGADGGDGEGGSWWGRGRGAP